MPQVPYQPYSEVPAQDIPTPNIHVQTPEGAFGQGTALAMKHLGTTMEHSGDELFHRAIALQELDNETKARQADLQVAKESGEEHAAFDALPGDQKAQQLSAHSDRLIAIYNKNREGLPNDSARKKFDAFALGNVGRSIFNAAGAAGTANRQYQAHTIQAQIEMNINDLYQDPSEKNWNDRLSQIKEHVQSLKEVGGMSEEQAQNESEKLISKAMAQRIKGINKHDPSMAADLLDDARKAKLIREPDATAIETTVMNARRMVTSANVAKEVNKDPEDPNKARPSLQEVDDAAAKRIKELLPDDPKAEADGRREARTEWARKRKDHVDMVQENRDVMVNEILKNPPKNWQELVSRNEKTYAAADALKNDPMTMLGLKRIIENQYNLDKNDRNKGDRARNFYELSGMGAAELVSKDLLNVDLAEKDRQILLNRQAKARVDPKDDARVERGMRAIQTMLPSGSNRLSREQMNVLKGAMQSTIEGYMEANGGKHPTDEEYKKFGKVLLQEGLDPTSGWFFSKGERKHKFEFGLPEDVKEKMEKMEEEQGVSPRMPDEQKRNMFVRGIVAKEYQGLFTKKKPGE